MIEITIYHMVFIGVAGFLAAIVDSVVGGGGLITTPALLSIGLPVTNAIGTSKVCILGALTSFLTFFRSGKIDLKILKVMPVSALGGALGAYTVNAIPEYIMKNIVVTALAIVAIYTFFRKDWGEESNVKPFNKNRVILIVFMAMTFGYYDGFFGPGTGTFLLFGFLNFGYSFVEASGNAKALNLASNFGALVVFIASSKMIFSLAFAMGLGQVLGARIGTRLAITKGASYVRTLFLTITTLLIGKQIYDLFLK